MQVCTSKTTEGAKQDLHWWKETEFFLSIKPDFNCLMKPFNFSVKYKQYPPSVFMGCKEKDI